MMQALLKNILELQGRDLFARLTNFLVKKGVPA